VVGRTCPRRATKGNWLLATIICTLALTAPLAYLTPGEASASGQTVTFSVPSGSMEPAIPVGSTVTVNRLAYRHHAVRVGDIIVFASPPTQDCGGAFASDLVKRVVGLPGQTISLSEGYVLINGRRLNETWLPSSVRSTTFPGPSGTRYDLTRPYRVLAGHYFVLGDNRSDSCDSRYFGPISKVLIVGKVTATVISIKGS
jgi:signal peptidase I